MPQDLSFGTAIDRNSEPVIMHDPVKAVTSFGTHEQRSPIESKTCGNILFNLLGLRFEQHQLLFQGLINTAFLDLKAGISGIDVEHQCVNKGTKDLD